MKFIRHLAFCKLFIMVFSISAQTTPDVSDRQTTADDIEYNETTTTEETPFTWTSLYEFSTESVVSDTGVVVEPSEMQTWEWYPLRWRWYVIVQAVSAGLGIVGNGIVMVVIYQRTTIIRSTDTLIGALAVSDFLTSVFLIPIPWAKQIPATILASVYCKVLYPNFPLWQCITTSNYLLMAICIERYIAVVYPLFFNRVISRRKVNVTVLAAWIISFVQLSHSFFTFGYDETIHNCHSRIQSTASRIAKGYSVFVLRLVIPTATMLITQILIARSLQRQAKHFRDTLCSGNTSEKGLPPGAPTFHLVARNNVIKMMLIVVIVFVVTWTPNQIAFLCFTLGYISPSYRGSPLHRALTVLGFVNSCANPFIYAARNGAFRDAVKGLLTCTRTSRTSLFEMKIPAKSVSQLDDLTSPSVKSQRPS